MSYVSLPQARAKEKTAIRNVLGGGNRVQNSQIGVECVREIDKSEGVV